MHVRNSSAATTAALEIDMSTTREKKTDSVIALETLQACFAITVLLMYRQTTVLVIVNGYQRHHDNNYANVITIIVTYLQSPGEFLYSGTPIMFITV